MSVAIWKHVRPGAVAICVALITLTACDRDLVTPEPPLTVTVYEVGSVAVQREREIHARVVPADLTRVAFRIPGKIVRLPVQAGQQVVKGQTIAQLEDSIQQQGLADAQAQYELSRRQLQRAENLFDIGAITPAQRDELNAGSRLAQARLGLARAQLAYTTVKAPFDGTVADVDREVFEAVAAGETVVTVYRNDRTDVLANLPDAISARSTTQDKKAFRTRARFSGDDTVYTLAYLKNSMARSPESQAFQFWLTMPASGARFPPGTPVTLMVNLLDAGLVPEEGLAVPLTALQAASEEGQFQVWLYKDGVVNPAPVNVARVASEGAMISNGVQAGDFIVTSGLARLSAGQVVEILPATKE